jgi:hypothetical protein
MDDKIFKTYLNDIYYGNCNNLPSQLKSLEDANYYLKEAKLLFCSHQCPCYINTQVNTYLNQHGVTGLYNFTSSRNAWNVKQCKDYH